MLFWHIDDPSPRPIEKYIDYGAAYVGVCICVGVIVSVRNISRISQQFKIKLAGYYIRAY